MNDYLDNVLNTRDDSDDDQYAGSFNSFVGNIINTVASSSLIQGSVSDIIIALNNSGIVVPLVMEALQNQIWELWLKQLLVDYTILVCLIILPLIHISNMLKEGLFK